MTIEYNEEPIEKHESLKHSPFLGYINPSGQIIDYSTILGEPHHDSWRNPVTPLFLNYISYLVLEDDLPFIKKRAEDPNKPWYKELYEKNKCDGFDYSVVRGPQYKNYNDLYYEEFISYLKNGINRVQEYKNSSSEWNRLKYDLMDFFEKCYSKDDFFRSFGRIVKLYSYEKIIETSKNKLIENGYDRSDNDKFYEEYRIMTLMSYFKDILVQYLGYDSFARAIPANGIFFDYGYAFSDTPRIITSCSNPNERFFNWILMDWEIQRIPKMIWDDNEKRFIEESNLIDYYQTDKEIVLGQEIDTIRKNVPKQYRKQFFR